MNQPIDLDIPPEFAILVEDRSQKDIKDFQEWIAKARAAGIRRDAIVNTLVGSGWAASFVIWCVDSAPTSVVADRPVEPIEREPGIASELRPTTGSAVSSGASRFSKKGNVEMVLIPAGEFTMGGIASDEKPQRQVYLDAYRIGRTPVTVGQFKAFCADTGVDFSKFPKPSWGWIADHPMVNVTWQEARDFCEWADGCLPTEAQWEKAARGTNGREYPWGNEFDRSRLRCSKDYAGDAKSTASVGSYSNGASPFGCLDMAGNAWEWCSDWYADSYSGQPDKNPVGPGNGTRRVLRGGSWYGNDPGRFCSAVRGYRGPADRIYFLGFRFAGPP